MLCCLLCLILLFLYQILSLLISGRGTMLSSFMGKAGSRSAALSLLHIIGIAHGKVKL